jgi:hypothetical protein
VTLSFCEAARAFGCLNNGIFNAKTFWEKNCITATSANSTEYFYLTLTQNSGQD